MNTITRQKTAYFPKQLKNKVEGIATTKAQKNKFFHILHLITTKSRREYSVDTEFIPLARNYFIEVLGKRYPEIIKPLKDSGIIQSNESYNVERNICKQYRLNPQLYYTHDKYEKAVFKYSYPKKWYDENISKKIGDTISYHKEHLKTLDILTIDKEHLYNVAYKVLENDLNKPLPKRKSKRKRTMQQYITSKKLHLFASIENICDPKALYARRNAQNFRLDTNFTNMSREIRQAIFNENDYISIDLKSSQYSILLKILKDNNVEAPDVDLFEHLIVTGQLYEYIRDFSDEATRDGAKDFMMNVAFGRQDVLTSRKVIFENLFPTISLFLNDWKEMNGYKEVPLALQRFESDLFIDRIKADVCKLGIANITCHDSIAVHLQHEDQVIDIMLKHFTELGLQGNVKNEYTREIIAI